MSAPRLRATQRGLNVQLALLLIAAVIVALYTGSIQ